MIVDDHPVVRKGLASFLGHEPDIEVVGLADSGEQALEMAAGIAPGRRAHGPVDAGHGRHRGDAAARRDRGRQRAS